MGLICRIRSGIFWDRILLVYVHCQKLGAPTYWWSQSSTSWGSVPSGPHGCCAWLLRPCNNDEWNITITTRAVTNSKIVVIRMLDECSFFITANNFLCAVDVWYAWWPYDVCMLTRHSFCSTVDWRCLVFIGYRLYINKADLTCS